MTLKVLHPDEIHDQLCKVFGVTKAELGTALGDATFNAGTLDSWAARSATARRVLELLRSATEEVYVAFVKGGDDVVKSIYDPPFKTAVIRIDKEYRLTEHGSVMDPRVLAFHELGHAVQHVVLTSESGGPLSEYLTAASNTKGEIPEFVTKKSVTIERGPRKGQTDIRVTKVSWFESYHFDYHLEMHNLRVHEWPISRELGVPIRSRYNLIEEV